MSGRYLLVLASLLLVSACSKGSSSTPSTAATPTPTPTAFPQHLYVSNDASSGGISQYTLPLTTGETANYSVAATNPTSLAFDTLGDLAAGSASGTITVYHTPFTAASVPAATFSNGAHVAGVAFYTGTLYAATEATSVNIYTPPFSNATTPSSTITLAGSSMTDGQGFDAAGTLYVANAVGGASGPSNLYAIAPPYTGTPVITPAITGDIYRAVAVLGSQLFVCNVGGSTGGIDVYALPLTATSAPSFTISTGINFPESLGFDIDGRLYVGNAGNATITVYTPAFSAASAPTTTLALPTGSAPYGLATGP